MGEIKEEDIKDDIVGGQLLSLFSGKGNKLDLITKLLPLKDIAGKYIQSQTGVDGEAAISALFELLGVVTSTSAPTQTSHCSNCEKTEAMLNSMIELTNKIIDKV